MFEKVDLRKVNKVVNFAGKQANLFDGNGRNEIPLLQCRGVTALCKILSTRKYAYLADEVGMGKTYQALGVMAMLLAEKPSAKILVITPGKNVQTNWQYEIKRFENNNLMFPMAFDFEPYDRPRDLMEHIIKKDNVYMNKNIFLLRLSSFSSVAGNLMHLHGKIEGKIRRKELEGAIADELQILPPFGLSKKEYDTSQAGCACGEIFNIFGRMPKFDLVIIDEAQNIRNDNNATRFLSAWLGFKRFEEDREIKVKEKSEKVLLMSATPAHRNVETLRNQLKYFESPGRIPGNIDHDYLENFMIRRLRTYGGDNKYKCRQNHAIDISGEMGIEQKLFMALIQKKLADLQGKNNAQFKIGFLETFESYDSFQMTYAEVDDESDEGKKEFENGNSHVKDEFGQAIDKRMMQKTAKSYEETFGENSFPPHPKLNYMEDSMVKSFGSVESEDANDKALVFVRRIASVDELYKRLNKCYETAIIRYWASEFGFDDDARLSSVQSRFESLYNRSVGKQKKITEMDNEDAEIYDNTSEERSRLRRWIAVTKSDKNKKYSAVSRFKKSLQRNKSNYDFFEENYLETLFSSHPEMFRDEKEYNRYVRTIVDDRFVLKVSDYINNDPGQYIKKAASGKVQYYRSNILNLCTYIALSEVNPALAENIKKYYEIGEKGQSDRVYLSKEEIIDIIDRGSVWDVILSLDNKNCDFLKCVEYDSFAKREIMKKCIQKFLTVSEAVLELLYCFCLNESKRRRKTKQAVNMKEYPSVSAIKKFRERIWDGKSGIYRRINQLIDNFDIVYDQLFPGTDNITVNSENLDFLNNQAWVAGAVGGGKNDAVIKRFNTPFYPDVIVCTDVMKEGINLHLFCNKVFHYGLAWTPGDLEQRVGRVDRFFSKTYRAREKGEDMRVEITYPFMGKTIDEQQLKKVLKFKIAVDPLLDTTCTKNIDVNSLESTTVQELAEYIPEESDSNTPFSGEKYWKN